MHETRCNFAAILNKIPSQRNPREVLSRRISVCFCIWPWLIQTKNVEESVLGITRNIKLLLFSYGLRTPVCITQVEQITKDKTRGQQQQQSLPRYPFLFTVTFSELLVYTNQRNQTNKEKDRVETKELRGTRALCK